MYQEDSHSHLRIYGESRHIEGFKVDRYERSSKGVSTPFDHASRLQKLMETFEVFTRVCCAPRAIDFVQIAIVGRNHSINLINYSFEYKKDKGMRRGRY